MLRFERFVSPSLGVFLSAALLGTAGTAAAQTSLTILHNNDGESQLRGDDFGGVARFKTLVDELRAEAAADGRGVVMLSSGDNYLAGPDYNASVTDPQGRNFDALAIEAIDYDAMAIGNHEFDFGPDYLAEFINAFSSPPPFVSANLDFTDEPELQALVDAGTIVPRTVIDVDGTSVGVVGATTPQISFISSPRNTIIDSDVTAVVQAQIDLLEADGVDIIILISHLQSVNNDLELIGALSGIDVAIAGGGDELLANDSDLLVDGSDEPYGPYPLETTNADGATVPVVTTSGQYNYLGRLEVEFDAAGNVTSFSGGPVRVADASFADGVEPDATLQASVVDPVSASVEGLASNVIGTTAVTLDGTRSLVRTQETNAGDLIADALLWQAQQLAADFGVGTPHVALQNGGGIRNDVVLEPGDITELATFNQLPFTNFVTVVENIPPRQFKEILENAVSQVENVSGRFAQVAGFSFVYDPDATAQVIDAETGLVTTRGRRVVDVTLDDGRRIVANGQLVLGAPSINVVTIDFLARGGDQYPFGDAAFTPMGVSYQRALANYIQDGLGGTVSAVDYPVGGEGRITTGEATVIAGASGDVSLTVTGADVGNLTVEFSRSVSGRGASWDWSAVTGSAGTASLTIDGPAPRGATGLYVARALDASGNVVARWGNIPVNAGQTVGVTLPLTGAAVVTSFGVVGKPAGTEAAPALALGGNHPNPFNPSTTISYQLPEAGPVRLAVYNSLGQQVRLLVNGDQPTGFHSVSWDARDDAGRAVSGGVYFSRLEHRTGVLTQRMTLLK